MKRQRINTWILAKELYGYEWFKTAREMLNYTTEEMSQVLCVTKQTISNLEHNKGSRALEAFYDITLQRLIMEESEDFQDKIWKVVKVLYKNEFED